MALTLEQFGLDRLPADDCLELLALLWDSLDESTFTPPEWHLREIEQRQAEAEAYPQSGVPWEEFKARWLGQP